MSTILQEQRENLPEMTERLIIAQEKESQHISRERKGASECRVPY
jgi:hypothetical protein